MSVSPPRVGRFAPSPTGHLHLGNALAALLAWLDARSANGTFLLRIEDIDRARCRSEYVESIFEDLHYLGLSWDGPAIFQSQREEAYTNALQQLQRNGRVYACSCSRMDVARAASAPHTGEDGPAYPRTCWQRGYPLPGRPTALRFQVQPGVTRFSDVLHGEYAQDVAADVGDFPVRRADGVWSYQLAVVVDDALTHVTRVVRGADLISSTPRQLQLYDALGWPRPEFVHGPLLLDINNRRLAKRFGLWTIRELRQRGVPAERITGFLACAVGLTEKLSLGAADLLSHFSWDRVSQHLRPVTEEDLARLL